jgi:hypothetical protein
MFSTISAPVAVSENRCSEGVKVVRIQNAAGFFHSCGKRCGSQKNPAKCGYFHPQAPGIDPENAAMLATSC